ncbi:MAG: LysM peptidoglycan-binding domain-containing protein, partial [Chitinophagaceae bacterium]
MKSALLSFLLIFSCQLLSSQIRSTSPLDQDKGVDKDVTIISHTVAMGETVKLISKKYLVTPLAIYKLNKAAVDGVQPGMTLQIPIPNSRRSGKADLADVSQNKPSEPEQIQHNVGKGETMASIAARYNISEDELKAANPQAASRKLHVEETLNIPSGGGLIPSNADASMSVGSNGEYQVQPGDTFAGIAKKFNTTITSIKQNNPKVASRGLRAG